MERSLDIPAPADTVPVWTIGRIMTAVAYAGLGLTLVLTRFVGLGKSLWEDEIYFVQHFVRRGPSEIVAGPNLSHELYGLLAWAATKATGESELMLMLLSAIPFVIGVLVATTWSHVRHGPIAGLLFLFLATTSPLLLDLSRQARGYGLAFLAMSVLIVAALELDRTGRRLAIVGMCAAGVVGTLTLPQFGIAFIGIGIACAAFAKHRRPVLVGLVASVVAVVAGYAPHLAQIGAASQVENGQRISTGWLLTAPIDQILLPALLWIEGTALIAGVVWLPLVVLAMVVIASSPLMRQTHTGVILAVGPIATIAVLWAAHAFVWPRYLSYLLVPLFIMLSTGAAAIFEQKATRPATLVRAGACLVLLVLLAANFAMTAPDVLRLPREANREVADLIESRTDARTPVLADLHAPANLAFYLDRAVQSPPRARIAASVCNRSETVVYVTQPFGRVPKSPACLHRLGTEHFRLEQYANGGEMNVWLVPPG